MYPELYNQPDPKGGWYTITVKKDECDQFKLVVPDAYLMYSEMYHGKGYYVFNVRMHEEDLLVLKLKFDFYKCKLSSLP